VTTKLNLIAISLIAAMIAGGCRPDAGPEDPLATGMAMIRAGANEDARDSLIAATAIYTNSVTAHCNLGLVYWALGDNTAAIASLTRASDLTEADIRPLEFLAHVLIDAGNEAGGRKVLSNVEEPTATTLTLMALAAYRAGSSDLARSYLGRALQLDATYAPALYNLALLCRDSYATPREALAYYKRFQEAAPNDRRAAESAQAFINMGPSAASDSAPAPDTDTEPPPAPHTPEPAPEPEPDPVVEVTVPTPEPTPTATVDDPTVDRLLAIADLELSRGNVDTALLTLKRAVKSHPDNADAIWALIELYDKHLEDKARAMEMHRKFSAMFPDDARALKAPPRTPTQPATDAETPSDAHFREGLKHYADKEWEKAIASYQKALKADPKGARAAYNLGLAYKANSDLDRAGKAFMVALGLQKDMPKALYMLGLTEAQLGRNAGALTHLNRLLRVQPDFAKAHYLLGQVYRGEGRPDMVLIHFERFLHLSPTGASADRARQWLQANRGSVEQ
jgi:tetratricopeptide (TPR) repeat protein